MEFILSILAVTMFLWTSIFDSKAEAAEFQRTSLSYLAGEGYVTGEHQRNIISFDTIKAGDIGLLYANVDLQSFTGTKSSNVSRVVGHLGNGFHLAGQLQNTAGYSNTNIGIGYNWFTPKGFAGIDVYRRADSLKGDGNYVFIFGKHILGSGFSIDGFVDISITDTNQRQLLAQPAIMYNVTKSFGIGLEQQLYIDKNYVRGLDESVTQLKLMYSW
jgi:hypothetical protein